MIHTQESGLNDVLSSARDAILAEKTGNKFQRMQGMQAFALERKIGELRTIVESMSSFEALSNNVSVRILSRIDHQNKDVNYDQLKDMQKNALEYMREAQKTLNGIGEDDPLYDTYSSTAAHIQSYLEAFTTDIPQTNENIHKYRDAMGKDLRVGLDTKDPLTLRTIVTDRFGVPKRATEERFSDLDPVEQQRIRSRKNAIGGDIKKAMIAALELGEAYKEFAARIKAKQQAEITRVHDAMMRIAIEAANIDGRNHTSEITSGEKFDNVARSIIDLATFLRSLRRGKGHQLNGDFADPGLILQHIETCAREARSESKTKFVQETNPQLIQEFTYALNGGTVQKMHTSPEQRAEKTNSRTIQKESTGLWARMRYLFGGQR